MRISVFREFAGKLVMAILICGLLVGDAISQSDNATSVEQREAKRAWESLIKTKGGRERLNSISSMLTQFDSLTRLEVFPNSRWQFAHWLDGRPSLQIYSGEDKLRVLAGTAGLEEIAHEDCGDDCWRNQIPYLLETKWYKPTPLRVTSEKFDKKTSDVIEVQMGGQQLAFVFEPEEMLVKEVRFFADGKVWQKFRLGNYVEIDGIEMPTLWSIGDIGDRFVDLNRMMPITFQFDVDYNPKIFGPPFIATTPDAWKRKPQ